MPKEPFTDQQVNAAIDYVITNGAEDRGKTISYSLVFIAGEMDLPQDLYYDGYSQVVYAFMQRFHELCIERNLPPLDSLVVNVAGRLEGRPGGGYFTINGLANPFSETRVAKPAAMVKAANFWESQKQQCYDWGVQHRRERLRSNRG
jgi:hypothetical protein